MQEQITERERLDRHYTHLAKKYDDAFFFAEGYRNWVAELIVNELGIEEDDSVIDLGGGTGFSAKMVHEKAGLQKDILCVDPCIEMLEGARMLMGVSALCSDALSFTRREDLRYDKILIKEAVHHFKDRIGKWKGIYRQLYPNGKLLIVTRPPQVDFPFFKAALRSFEQCQPHYDILRTELESAGFHVGVIVRAYPLKVNKEYWFEKIRQRFMSNLADFDGEELNQGLRELEKEYKAKETLDFADRLVFIVGSKSRVVPSIPDKSPCLLS